MMNFTVNNELSQCFIGDFLDFISVDNEVLISSFCGAIIFIAMAVDFTITCRITFFSISIIIGVVLSGFVANILAVLLSNLLHINIDVPNSVGAMISAAGAVRLLMFFV
ncbi:TPA: putative holin [Salmonella enterica]|nr:hypothetical protein [Salmonella enterica subsp. enterica]